MNQEDKQLLLKDLCMRIPYRTFVCLNPGAYNKPETCLLTGVHGEKVHLNVDSDPFRIDSIKPYLRSMSSITEEEQRTLDSMCNGVEMVSRLSGLRMFDKAFDWLNANHFDYHIVPSTGKSMIESGLALEAPEGIYKQ